MDTTGIRYEKGQTLAQAVSYWVLLKASKCNAWKKMLKNTKLTKLKRNQKQVDQVDNKDAVDHAKKQSRGS